MERRGREIPLLVPGGGRQHDVGPLGRLGHLVVDVDDELHLRQALVDLIDVRRLQQEVAEREEQSLEPVLGIRDGGVHRLGGAGHPVDRRDDRAVDVVGEVPRRCDDADPVLADVDAETAAGPPDVAGHDREQPVRTPREISVVPVVRAAAHQDRRRFRARVGDGQPLDEACIDAGDRRGGLGRPGLDLDADVVPAGAGDRHRAVGERDLVRTGEGGLDARGHPELVDADDRRGSGGLVPDDEALRRAAAAQVGLAQALAGGLVHEQGGVRVRP